MQLTSKVIFQSITYFDTQYVCPAQYHPCPYILSSFFPSDLTPSIFIKPVFEKLKSHWHLTVES